MFCARASVTPKRVLRSLRTQKVLATVYVKQRAQLRVRACATDGSPIKMRNISIKTRARSGLPIHTTAENLCTCDLVTPKNASRDLFAVISVRNNGTVNENISAGRATDCPPIKMHHLERYTSPECCWPAGASDNRRKAPHAFGPRKRPGNSLHSKCARNGTCAHQTAGAPLGRAIGMLNVSLLAILLCYHVIL